MTITSSMQAFHLSKPWDCLRNWLESIFCFQGWMLNLHMCVLTPGSHPDWHCLQNIQTGRCIGKTWAREVRGFCQTLGLLHRYLLFLVVFPFISEPGLPLIPAQHPAVWRLFLFWYPLWLPKFSFSLFWALHILFLFWSVLGLRCKNSVFLLHLRQGKNYPELPNISAHCSHAYLCRDSSRPFWWQRDLRNEVNLTLESGHTSPWPLILGTVCLTDIPLVCC